MYKHKQTVSSDNGVYHRHFNNINTLTLNELADNKNNTHAHTSSIYQEWNQQYVLFIMHGNTSLCS